MAEMETSQGTKSLEKVSLAIGANQSFHVADFHELKAWLQRHWIAAVGDCPAVSAVWFERIYRNYTESTRHYHTAVHLKEMLEYVQAIEESIDPTIPSVDIVLRLATFFHDVVYDPTSTRNEVDSADVFEHFCQDVSLDGDIRVMVKTLILATEKHKPIENEPFVDSLLQKYFLDIDMAVLGKKSSAYLAYASLIRKEYEHVPRAEYCEKRAAILEAFCQKQIYLTDTFQALLEEQAKENLRKEISLLQKGIIPGESVEDIFGK